MAKYGMGFGREITAVSPSLSWRGCPIAGSLAASRLSASHTRSLPAASQNPRLNQSPIDALIDIKLGHRLRRQIPIRLDLGALTHLRITILPQRRPARRRDVRRLRPHPDVLQYLPDISTVRGERDHWY